jgi:hypothetical protein
MGSRTEWRGSEAWPCESSTVNGYRCSCSGGTRTGRLCPIAAPFWLPLRKGRIAARNMIPAAYPTCSTATARTAMRRWVNIPCTGALTTATRKAASSTHPKKTSRMNVPHRAPIANSPAPIQYIFPLPPLRAQLRSASSAWHIMVAATNQNQHRAVSPGLEGPCSDRLHARNSPHEDNVEKMTLCSTNQPLLKSRLIDQNVRKILLTKISEKFKGFSISRVEFLPLCHDLVTRFL